MGNGDDINVFVKNLQGFKGSSTAARGDQYLSYGKLLGPLGDGFKDSLGIFPSWFMEITAGYVAVRR
jgi:hypothetical protein